jgi:hypothetical protein
MAARKVLYLRHGSRGSGSVDGGGDSVQYDVGPEGVERRRRGRGKRQGIRSRGEGLGRGGGCVQTVYVACRASQPSLIAHSPHELHFPTQIWSQTPSHHDRVAIDFTLHARHNTTRQQFALSVHSSKQQQVYHCYCTTADLRLVCPQHKSLPSPSPPSAAAIDTHRRSQRD